MNKPAITKVLSVTDTRQYEEISDRWVAIPGTGEANECARCGRLHEVHAVVALSDGTTATVGTGCMSATDMDATVAAALKSATSAAKTVARLRAQLASLQARREQHRAAIHAAQALPFPAITLEAREHGLTVYRMGDAVRYSRDSMQDVEMDLRRGYQSNRTVELGGVEHPGLLYTSVKDTQARLAKAEARLSTGWQFIAEKGA